MTTTRYAHAIANPGQWPDWYGDNPPAPSAGQDPELWRLAAWDASLGVGHCWTATRCPAYRSRDPVDCQCGS